MGARPLSLLFLNPMGRDGWGGVERWLFDLAVGLRDRGHRVVSAGGPESVWSLRTEAEGFPTCRLPMRSDFAPGQARTLARFLREHRVDVVGTKLHRGIRVGGLAARLAGRPPVVAFMGLVETEPGWRYRMTYRLFLDGVVTLSAAMRDEIVLRGRLDPARVVAIPYGVRPGDYELPAPVRESVRREWGVDDATPVALALGRVHRQKRFDVLLDAWRLVAERIPAARLLIAGEGKLQSELEAHRRRLGLDDSVRFIGFRRDVARCLAGADCLAMSSDFEGLPMVAIEALAAARPVVATRVGSIAEIVEDGRSGRLVAKGDPAALAGALTEVLGSADRGRALGAAGRAHVVERFPLSRCVEETERHLVAVRG